MIKTDIETVAYYDTLSKEKLEEIITELTISENPDREWLVYTGDGKGDLCRLEDSSMFDEYMRKALDNYNIYLANNVNELTDCKTKELR